MATRKSDRLAAKQNTGSSKEGAHGVHGKRDGGDDRAKGRRTSVGGAMGLTPARPNVDSPTNYSSLPNSSTNTHIYTHTYTHIYTLCYLVF